MVFGRRISTWNWQFVWFTRVVSLEADRILTVYWIATEALLPFAVHFSWWNYETGEEEKSENKSSQEETNNNEIGRECFPVCPLPSFHISIHPQLRLQGWKDFDAICIQRHFLFPCITNGRATRWQIDRQTYPNTQSLFHSSVAFTASWRQRRQRRLH